jgi:hypothetical protein
MKRIHIGIVGIVVMAIFVGVRVGLAGDSDSQGNSSYDAPSSSEPETAHVPYSPPEKPASPEMHPDSDRTVEHREGEEHDREDETTNRSIGEGQDRESPEAP